MGELKKKTENPSLWENPNEARAYLKKISILEKKIISAEKLYDDFDYLKEIFNMASIELDNKILKEVLIMSKKICDKSKQLQTENLLSEEIDTNNCYIEIHAGAGGTESQDWAQMLVRMYLRWSENQNFKTTNIQENYGEEAGIKSSTIKIDGDYSFGWLKYESGIHRLVRISPFDSNKRRHTSFASVWVYPEVDERIEIDFKESELRIDTYRASGAGGQHVNKTDSAVRITHIPSKIVVQCQNNRSQHKNKATALKMLQSKLYEFEIRKKEEEKKSQLSKKKDIGWGNQIRSYVLHPYQMVKDLRTEFTSSDANGVLNGNLTSFLEKSLVYYKSKS
ncbi:MAG: Peptide chain release factor 2 [Alphaproteobacteria bacterium MarineAlpha5_Bin10]|nr:MAG: Peptide chain release factor 2 [Alphaproteobacteria bacterium MarineAlpha5_Bin10]